MFESEDLKKHLKSSHTVETEAAIYAEWNLNEPENIKITGNYRYRPNDTESIYSSISSIYDPIDARNDYTGATDADTTLDGGFDDEGNPVFFTPKNKKMELLYSLEDCLKPYRPRSGINKILYLSTISAPSGYNQYLDDLTRFVARRPRYYMSSKFDLFKYWTSYRTEAWSVIDEQGNEFAETVELGVSENDVAGNYFISDAAPFVIYKDPVPANRIVIKMQTNVGEEDLGPFRLGFEGNVLDPLYGDDNRTVPKQWKIQVLKDNVWIDAIEFSRYTLRSDGSQVIKADGYVEVAYGLDIPERFADIYVDAGSVVSQDVLPDFAPLGYAYLVGGNESNAGKIWIYDGSNSISEKPGWASFDAKYSWTLIEEGVSRTSKIVKNVFNPGYFVVNNKDVFREVDFIGGIRVVVDQMNVPNTTFDLIEMSPRLTVDISDLVTNFSITRTLSDLANSSVPVGSLYPSSGSLSLFDSDFVFNENNSFDPRTRKGSLVSSRRTSKIKFNFYEIVKNVDGYDYFIPVKTMYSEGVPRVSDASVNVEIQLRDFYFYLESVKAPEMLLTDVSLSYAITVLLDNIGFSNYIFKRLDGEQDFIIPYFFVGSEQNVAQVLQDLAISTQTAMFFDEYNNFVVMSKGYLLPENDSRNVDFSFYGHEDEWEVASGNAKVINDYATIIMDEKHYLEVGDQIIVSGFDININGPRMVDSITDTTFGFNVDGASNGVSSSVGYIKSQNLPNIVNIASEEKKVYNNGQIDYTTRYLQRSIGKYAQAYYNAEGQNYVYKPVLLWEVAPPEIVSSVNELPSQAQGFYLSAAPLRTTLTADTPYVDGNVIYNNVMDFGENVYWMTSKHSGYMYANAEIIKYDAIEYSVQGVGNVWISNNHEYQDYLSKLQFNGKMYPTGNVRIWTEPEYQTVDGVLKLKNGPVKKHGRGQFGTKVVQHSAGLTSDPYWTDPENVRGIVQEAKQYLFPMTDNISYPAGLSQGVAGKAKATPLINIDADEYAKNSTRNGVIKNFLSNKNLTEKDVSYYKTANAGTVQTSALVFSGPDIPDQLDESDFVSYIYKDLSTVVPPQVVDLDETTSIIEDENTSYTHFGTRMRIVGKIESGTNKSQSPIGAYEIFNSNIASSTDPSDLVSFGGGSGGIGFSVNKDTNNGYFFEAVALTSDQIQNYQSNIGKTSFVIVKTYTDGVQDIPGIRVNNDIIVAVTETQHNFNINDKVIITGATDVNNPNNSNTRINGQHTIIAVSEDRKSFTAQITSPTQTQVPIISAQGNNVNITFRTVEKIFSAGQLVTISGSSNSAFDVENAVIVSTKSDSITSTITSAEKVIESGNTYARYFTAAQHQFVVGQKVDISGLSPEDFNIKSGIVTEVETPNSFKVLYPSLTSTESVLGDNGTAYGIAETFTIARQESGNSVGGLATYVPLTTTAVLGGTVEKSITEDLNIYNLFFYKVLAGQNVAQIVKKKKDAKTGFVANQATLTTIQPHPFAIGDEISIDINDPQFDGVYTINEITEFTFTYTTNNFEVVPEQDLQEFGTAIATQNSAIPQILWSGFTEINVDGGLFATETRFTNSEQTTVYDLSAEYVPIDAGRRFYLYFNGKQIATVDDPTPLPIYNNIVLFVRGSSRVMFENIYAIGKNTNDKLFYPNVAPIIQNAYGNLADQKTSDVIRRYGMSDIIKNTYCSGLSAQEPPKYNLYFEEFGTIMREVAYFNVKYDRSYPALIAKLAPTINDIKAYNVSGFYAGSYRAEFLVFNNMDKTINLDDTTGNYLRIYGISFTQNTTKTITLDDYLNKVGNFSDPQIQDGTILYNPFTYKEIYDTIKHSRIRYGNSEFALQSPFIQTTAAAEEMLDWVIKKTYLPKKAVGIATFAASTLQLGDVCKINYKNSNGIYVVSDPQKNYVVYNIEYSKNGPETSMTAYLVEV